MAIKGSLREASLPDVLQLLSMGKKTGCLGVTHRGSFGYVYFAEGKIAHASIVNRRDRIGELLVKVGSITDAQLRSAIEAQETHRDKRLGELLVELGHITRDALHELVRVQIEEAVYQMFTWNEGTFNFEAGVRPDPHEVLVSIGPESLMLEGARRVDEWGVIEKKITSFDMVFEADLSKLAALPSNFALTTEQQTVLQHVDGRRDVAHIVESSGLAEFDVGKALYGLMIAGLIIRVGSSTKAAAPVTGAKVEEHRNLGVAFYRSSMYEEAFREFRRVLELSKDDARALFYVGTMHLRQGHWAEAITAYQSAAAHADARAAVFHNLAIAFERVGNYPEALSALGEAKRRSGGTDARIQTSIGVVSLVMGDVAAADAAFSAAKALWRPQPSAVWYHYAGLSAATLGDLARAQEILEEGMARHPHAAPLHNNLAVLLERRGAYDEALAAGERGLAEDPTIPQLHKNIGDLYYRAGRHDEAFEAYQRAIRADEKLGGDVYLKLGNIRLRRRQRVEAAQCWERALDLDPGNAIVRTNLEALKRAS